MKKANQNLRVTKKTRKKAAERRLFPGLAAMSVADVVDRYKQAVVNIEVSKREPEKSSESSSRRRRGHPLPIADSFDEKPKRNTTNIGTGFFFDPRGYILTNEHVIHNAEEVFVRFYNQDRLMRAEVVKTSYKDDLAVLKVHPPKNCRTIPLGRSDSVRAGEWVVAIGCPLGLDHSVTVGIVSALERPIQIGDRHYPHLLQTDAAINRGNSGGPLINLRGQVIGMNTAVSASSQGIGFAIAVDQVKHVVRDLMSGVPKLRRRAGKGRKR
ncbi:trypsin-like peptidase domain-containing protein [Tumebacillus sp. DT12]|uniref:Trypsin-like peptidase domain-containing protein n=1 Tax=Tumebacillus lacus TaxID=2995335 RepID=A0ABT3WWJ9_9BACL|nr:trypsin-like peptidase domain-containing protein [Tumebacillus lacus]MCX7569019.1 trypsin-like peptidase domain-containing protein [Tumebacillus lacus]